MFAPKTTSLVADNSIVEVSANLVGQKGTYLLLDLSRSGQLRDNSSRLYLSSLKYFAAFKYFSTSLPY